MSFLGVLPEAVSEAGGELEKLGSALRGATTAVAAQTTAIAAPAADEVSAAITALFGANAREFQAASAKALAFQDEFIGLLRGGAAQYLSTEVANAQQALVTGISLPAEALLVDDPPHFIIPLDAEMAFVQVALPPFLPTVHLPAFLSAVHLPAFNWPEPDLSRLTNSLPEPYASELASFAYYYAAISPTLTSPFARGLFALYGITRVEAFAYALAIYVSFGGV